MSKNGEFITPNSIIKKPAQLSVTQAMRALNIKQTDDIQHSNIAYPCAEYFMQNNVNSQQQPIAGVLMTIKHKNQRISFNYTGDDEYAKQWTNQLFSSKQSMNSKHEVFK